MIDKARLGLPDFDAQYGGIYRHRAVLCIGRHGTGKTILALQCMMQAVAAGERPLMLTGWHANDLAIIAQQHLGFAIEEALGRSDAILLEYAGMVTKQDEANITLPPTSFSELLQIVESRGVTRVILDTALPWVAIPQRDRLPKHVYSFVQALDRMGVTSLLTLPKPASPMAYTLRNLLEEHIPIVFSLEMDPGSANRTLTVNKYLGESVLPAPLGLSLATGRGFVAAAGQPAQPIPPVNVGISRQGPIRFASAFGSTP